MVTLCQLDWAKRHPECWLSITSGCIDDEVSGGISIWLNRLDKEDLPSSVWVASSNLLRAQENKKVETRGTGTSLFLSWDAYFLPPLGIHTPGSWAFGLQDLHQSFSCLQTGSYTKGTNLELRLNYTTSFPGCPTCRQQIMASIAMWANS